MTLEEYKKIEDERLEIVLKHMENGVEFVDIHSAYISAEAEIGRGTLIGP